MWLPCSSVGPSHRLLFFKNCSSIGLFHGVQSFRNVFLQRKSSMGLWVLPEACSSMGSPQGQSLLWAHPPALVFHGLQCGYLLHCGPPLDAAGQPASPWSSPWAAGESLLRCLERFIPLLLLSLWCLHSCFVHIFSFLSHSCCTSFF